MVDKISGSYLLKRCNPATITREGSFRWHAGDQCTMLESLVDSIEVGLPLVLHRPNEGPNHCTQARANEHGCSRVSHSHGDMAEGL